MALRSIWNGVLRFSLVSVPVEAYAAAEPDEGDIHLNQLHDACHSRIRYQKTCPIHGVVDNAEIVTGYEYAKDQYVIVDKKEVEAAQTKGDRALEIQTFINPAELDPMYYAGRSYYLAPRPGGEKPYVVLARAMEKERRCAVATIVLHTREHVAVVRPVEHVLAMTMLHYEQQLRKPAAIQDEAPAAKVDPRELKLAEQLIEAATDDDFDLGSFHDHYTERLRELIDAKIAGQEVVTPPAAEKRPEVINLMDALKKSVQQQAKRKKG